MSTLSQAKISTHCPWTLCQVNSVSESPQHHLGGPALAAGKGDGSSSEDLLGYYNTVSPDVIYCINSRNRYSSIAAA